MILLLIEVMPMNAGGNQLASVVTDTGMGR
jgi:hypothetical protein